MPRVVKLDHPLVRHHLTVLRDGKIGAERFRAALDRLSVVLALEATRDLELERVSVQTPLAEAEGHQILARIAIVPILRAGLGMIQPLLHMIPEAYVWHLGLYRDELTAKPVEYYNRLPTGPAVDVALVLDPMLATGGSAAAALAQLARGRAARVKLLAIIAAEAGIERVLSEFPDTELYVCAIDPALDARHFIVPGLGDAGDRAFNTGKSRG